MRSNTSFVARSKEQFWREALRRFGDSGQTVRAYCAAQRLSEASFYAWRRALAQRDRRRSMGGPKPAASGPGFLPVRLAQAAGGHIDIALTNGHRIHLCGPVDRADLAAVVAVLQEVPAASSATA